MSTASSRFWASCAATAQRNRSSTLVDAKESGVEKTSEKVMLLFEQDARRVLNDELSPTVEGEGAKVLGRGVGGDGREIFSRDLDESSSSGALDLPKREASDESPNLRGAPFGVKDAPFGVAASMIEMASRDGNSKGNFMIGNENGEELWGSSCRVTIQGTPMKKDPDCHTESHQHRGLEE